MVTGCQKCGKWKRGSEVAETDEGTQQFICFTCAPELQFLYCTVCCTDKPRTEFQGDYKKLVKASIRRCNTCRTCIVCKDFFQNARAMQWNSKLCCTCYAKARTEHFTCYVCEEPKTHIDFDTHVLKNHKVLLRH